MARPLKVLVVDDSALIRKLLTDVLTGDPRIGEVRTARDPYVARDMIKAFEPDVLTLDVEMPRMDGLTFLRNLMRLRPMPVVMISSLTTAGVKTTLEALELGAIDFVSKPTVDVSNALPLFAEEIIGKVLNAATTRPRALAAHARKPPAQSAPIGFDTTDKLIAIGSSTGGTEAVRHVIGALPADSPAVVIAQHIPPQFSRSFADRLDRIARMKVCEASDGDPILPGHVFVAPGGLHLRVRRDGARWRCAVDASEPVNRHRPSVDVLFDSVATAAGHNAIGVILTGMGRDGAEGLKRMLAAGSTTIAQDEASSVVWGMPGAAVQIGAASEVLSLGDIPGRLMDLVRTRSLAAAGAR